MSFQGILYVKYAPEFKQTQGGTIMTMGASQKIYHPTDKQDHWENYTLTFFVKDEKQYEYFKTVVAGCNIYVEAENVVIDRYWFDQGKKKLMLTYPKIKKVINFDKAKQPSSNGQETQIPQRMPPKQTPEQKGETFQQYQNRTQGQRETWGNQPQQKPEQYQNLHNLHKNERQQPQQQPPNFNDFDDDIPF